MYSVYQHWDPLKVCVVGRSYPPEFYSWIENVKVRKLFEKIAQETEEDFQNVINKLQSFGVEILRPDLPDEDVLLDTKIKKPPMCPRDDMVMIGSTFYESQSTNFSKLQYKDIKDLSWPACNTWNDFNQLPTQIQQECIDVFGFGKMQKTSNLYNKIFEHIRQQGNTIKTGASWVNGANVSRIGRDLYVGTFGVLTEQAKFATQIDREFTQTRNHVVDAEGHTDGTFCPVCPGLIISLLDIPTYKDTFPDWEVVYLPDQSWSAVRPFLDLKKKNGGKWWIPGFEYDNDVINTVETWLQDWVGYVEETVFDVNMLIIDPKNVMVFNYNEQVFNALNRYGITPHVVPFRHRYFWDGGLHCITTDLHRDGIMQDYFK